MNDGYREFEFNLPGALLGQLTALLDEMTGAPLNSGNLATVENAQGVYQLLLNGKVVYIGKTDAEAGLKKRLERHLEKVQHRRGLSPQQLSFKAVRIYVFTAMDLETQLIRHYGSEKGTAWNNSGFGANDPGRNRDKTKIDDGNFDALYPINIDRELEATFSGTQTAASVVSSLKNNLPYTFRFEPNSRRSRQPHAELVTTSVTISPESKTTRQIVTELTRQLPSGWQATAFGSHVILYREAVDDYPDATILARSS